MGAEAPPIGRRAQEAKPGQRKRAGTIGGISGDHFIQVKAEFGDQLDKGKPDDAFFQPFFTKAAESGFDAICKPLIQLRKEDATLVGLASWSQEHDLDPEPTDILVLEPVSSSEYDIMVSGLQVTYHLFKASPCGVQFPPNPHPSIGNAITIICIESFPP